MPVTDHRLSNRQIMVLKHLAVCCANGGITTLTRDEREAMTPLWRRGTVEMFMRCSPDQGSKGMPFFRPTASGWALIRAILAAGLPARRQPNGFHLASARASAVIGHPAVRSPHR